MDVDEYPISVEIPLVEFLPLVMSEVERYFAHRRDDGGSPPIRGRHDLESMVIRISGTAQQCWEVLCDVHGILLTGSFDWGNREEGQSDQHIAGDRRSSVVRHRNQSGFHGSRGRRRIYSAPRLTKTTLHSSLLDHTIYFCSSNIEHFEPELFDPLPQVLLDRLSRSVSTLGLLNDESLDKVTGPQISKIAIDAEKCITDDGLIRAVMKCAHNLRSLHITSLCHLWNITLKHICTLAGRNITDLNIAGSFVKEIHESPMTYIRGIYIGDIVVLVT